MTALRLYRDDGPLATFISRTVGRAVPVGELQLTLLAAVSLMAVLAVASRPLSTYAVAAGALVFVVLAGAAAGRDHACPLSWLAPPLLRAGEYAFLITLTAHVDRGAMPSCFVFLSVIAFHHYNAAYLLRHRGVAPPRWVYEVGAGWDGRMLIASALALAGVLEVGLLAGALGLALVYVSEATLSSLRDARTGRAPVYDEGDEELVE